MIQSYPSIYALGHKALTELLLDDVLVQEKIDGSQISFGVYPTTVHYSSIAGDPLVVAGPPELRVRSKGAEINVIAPDKMFAKGVEVIKSLAAQLVPGWTYRGEYLAKPKHNALAYDRIPQNHIILFDIDKGDQDYADVVELDIEAQRLGLERVPTLAWGKIDDLQMFQRLLDTVSILGGQKIEGVVVKNYHRFGPDKKVLMGKFVSEAFKEVHAEEWRKANPTAGDIIQVVGSRYHTDARWAKAVQHLKEAGQLEGSPRDIGLLIREVPEDIEKECEQEIKDALYDWAWPKIRRIVTAGLPEWYKQRLLEEQFNA